MYVTVGCGRSKTHRHNVIDRALGDIRDGRLREIATCHNVGLGVRDGRLWDIKRPRHVARINGVSARKRLSNRQYESVTRGDVFNQ